MDRQQFTTILCSYRDGNGRLCRCHLQVYRDVTIAGRVEETCG